MKTVLATTSLAIILSGCAGSQGPQNNQTRFNQTRSNPDAYTLVKSSQIDKTKQLHFSECISDGFSNAFGAHQRMQTQMMRVKMIRIEQFIALFGIPLVSVDVTDEGQVALYVNKAMSGKPFETTSGEEEAFNRCLTKVAS